MTGIFTPIVIRDGLPEGTRIGLQSSADHPLGGGGGFVCQEAGMHQPALALNQHIEPMGAIPGHIVLPVPLRLMRGGRLWPVLQSPPVLDVLTSLSVRLLGCRWRWWRGRKALNSNATE
ncbi:MAG: hypothetical protein ACPGYT_12630 [Nitrospirales bacterium]